MRTSFTSLPSGGTPREAVNRNTSQSNSRSSGQMVTRGMGKCGDEADVILRGGKLHIAWDRTQNLLYMTGPAAFVFDGTVTL